MVSAVSGPVTEAAPLPSRAVPSLTANFKWTFSGNVVYAACQWGMLSILAKAGSPALVGQFALGLAIAAPVFMLTSLALRPVQATDVRSEFEFSDYFTLRALTSIFGLLTVVAIAWIFTSDRATRLVVLLVGTAKALESLSDVIAGLLQKVERLDQVAASLIVRGVLSVAAFGAACLWTRSLQGAVAALVVVWAAVFLLYDVWRARAVLGGESAFFSPRAIRLKKLLVMCAPLGLVMALSSANVNLPRYLLVRYMGQAELGIFASMAYLVMAATLIINALGQSATARLARMFANQDRAGFRRVMERLLLTAAIIPAVGVPIALLFGRTLLTLLYRPEYADHASVLVILVVATGLTAVGSFMGYGLTATRSFRIQPLILSVTILTTLALCLVMIPRYGMSGAAVALLCSEFVFAVSSTIALRNALHRSWRA